jgi:large subunit ribosomal protein L13
MILDAKDQVLGRLASFAAKKALLGEDVNIVNCEKAIVTGSKFDILRKYNLRRGKGQPTKGPFFARRPDLFVRRTVRGMLPYKNYRGKKAYSKVKCHLGVPEALSGKGVQPEKAHISKLQNLKYLYVDELCRLLGAKWQKR